jgi:hypothetical protein
MLSLPFLLVSASQRRADRLRAPCIGADRRDPDRRSPQVIVQSRAFVQQATSQRIDVVDQGYDPGPIVHVDGFGVDRQTVQPAQQLLCANGAVARDVSHGYLIAEIRVSNILFTVVITCEAAE